MQDHDELPENHQTLQQIMNSSSIDNIESLLRQNHDYCDDCMLKLFRAYAAGLPGAVVAPPGHAGPGGGGGDPGTGPPPPGPRRPRPGDLRHRGWPGVGGARRDGARPGPGRRGGLPGTPGQPSRQTS